MEKTQTKLRISTVFLLFQTIVWLVFTFISMSQVKSEWTSGDFLRWASHPDIFFLINYGNATLLTLVAVWFFYNLLSYLDFEFGNYKKTCFTFVILYGALNVCCYASQVFLIPSLAQKTLATAEDFDFMVNFIHAYSFSLVAFANGLAYAVLGIPSLLAGLSLFGNNKKVSGVLLIMNGVFCLIGLLGFIIKSRYLMLGTMLGGIAFLFSLGAILIECKDKREKA
ncbi:hypothetical protein SpiGrapes_0059 [Sphaerochaeta pleomorpha str. Grapes]|uniref:DUF4386 domain-containing protein n=1 Tax=Sphaerochaeta pleomorpha (strain ATCC BAA-1885 / DSM 22778 / Grapes) TaxID=158190 RepID=G8QT18_SPHPG|nr:hypothetical protein [Sphaerochaeta pleomorpha]AEV27923.1 hypothetical protein SpiGrapes_0059 [Sphaerochaeta pleomorpha str. Grapes]